MPTLTRRRCPDTRREAWLIYYGDVQVGTIAERTGNPTGTPAWQWHCGFYPGSHPGEHASGSADTFDQARAAFEAAWAAFLAKRTETDFEEYRRDRAFRAWKEAMWAAGCRLPTQVAEGCSSCFCGAPITIASVGQHVLIAHREPEAA